MKIKFKNGVTKECDAPKEQKIYKNSGEKIEDAGWLVNLRINGIMTSNEVDELLIPENISSMKFFDYGDNEKNEFILNGYEKVTSSVINYSENISEAYAEIQLSKGV